MSISIIKPGLLGTIQDMGRYGYGSLGINCGGAMDRYASQLANIFEQNALISITGANFSATLNDELLPLWQPLLIRKNTILHFPELKNGARCYIGVHGGFNINSWLNSYSTNLKATVGGFLGRKFEKGDQLTFKESSVYFAALMKEGKDVHALGWRPDTGKTYQYPHEIFFIEGNEFPHLTETSVSDLLQNNFILHPSSDRMGYHIKGPELKLKDSIELISTGVGFGTIQLLPNGQLIVLMADHQTTGGYPRIGHVISAHLPKLAQLRPSDCIQFKRTHIATAEDLLFSQQQELLIIQRACFDHLNELVC
jgi:antagonist of KipI